MTNCGAHPTARPSLLVLACGDGNTYIQHLAWSDWGTRQARGRGVIAQNDCRPNCAAGHFHDYPASVSLSGVTGTPAGPRFSVLTARFSAANPDGRSTETYDLITGPPGP